MAKKVAFKKKPVKTKETEEKLDQWLEEKTKEQSETDSTPAQAPIEAAIETAAAPAEEQTKTLPAEDKSPAPANNNKAPLTAIDETVSFDEQEELIEVAQVTFHMPKTLQRRLKFECFRQDKTIKDYVIDLLDKKLPKETPF